MRLDKERGEALGNLGIPHIVPVEDWEDLNKVKFEVEVDRPDGKWPDKRKISILDHACLMAQRTFLNAGALWPVSFDESHLTVQWYPAKKTVVVLFQYSVRGKILFCHFTYKPTAAHIRWLCFKRSWPKPVGTGLSDQPASAADALN